MKNDSLYSDSHGSPPSLTTGGRVAPDLDEGAVKNDWLYPG